MDLIYNEGGRSFTFAKATIQNPFLLPADETVSPSSALTFIDTTTRPLFKDTNTQLALFDDDTQVYIVVRGTEGFSWPNGIRDWVSNVQAVAVNFQEGHGKVHEGFYKCFTSVKTSIDTFLKENGRANKKIVVTGHSLGGAVATLIAAYIRGHYHNDVMLYTFGSPRAGDADFVNHYTQAERVHAWRLFNVCDVVPMVPTKHTDIVLPILINSMSSICPIAFINFHPTIDLSPFTHFGVPVALKKTTHGGVMLVNPKTPPPFEFYSNNPSDDYKVKWTKLAALTAASVPVLTNPVYLTIYAPPKDLFKTLGEAIIGAHEMPTYIDIIGSVLRQWAKVYIDSDLLSHDPSNAKHLEERIKGLQETQDQLMLDSLKEQAVQPSDATSTPGSRMTVAEKKRTAQEALDAMLSQKAEMEAQLSLLNNPKAIAALIAGREYNAHVHREIEFQAQVK